MKSVIAILLGGLLVTASSGCGEKKKSGPQPPPDIDGLAALGDGVKIVVGGDVEKLVASRLVRRGVEAMFDRDANLKTQTLAMIDECQLAPGENVDSFLIGLGDGPTDLLLVVSGTFEENALTACVQKRLGEGGGRLQAQSFAHDGTQRTTYRADGAADEPIWFALGSPRTLIVAGSQEWLHMGLGEGPRFAASADAKALLDAAPTENTLWATGFVPREIGEQLASATAGAIKPPKTMRARLDFVAGIQAELSGEMATAADANSLKTLWDMQRPAVVAMAQARGLGKLAAKLVIESDDKYVKVRLEADEAELSTLLATVDTEPEGLQNPPSPEQPSNQSGDGPKEQKSDEGNAPPDGKAPLRR